MSIRQFYYMSYVTNVDCKFKIYTGATGIFTWMYMKATKKTGSLCTKNIDILTLNLFTDGYTNLYLQYNAITNKKRN